MQIPTSSAVAIALLIFLVLWFLAHQHLAFPVLQLGGLGQ